MKRDKAFALLAFCALGIFIGTETVRLNQSLNHIENMDSGTLYKRRVVGSAVAQSKNDYFTESRNPGNENEAVTNNATDILSEGSCPSSDVSAASADAEISQNTDSVNGAVASDLKTSSLESMGNLTHPADADTSQAEDISRIVTEKSDNPSASRDDQWVSGILALGRGSSRVAWSYFRRAMSAREAGELTRATQFFARALEESREVLAELDHGLGAMVVADIGQALERAPGNIRLMARAAYFQEALGNLGKAMDLYRELVELTADSQLRGHFTDRLVSLNSGFSVQTFSSDISSDEEDENIGDSAVDGVEAVDVVDAVGEAGDINGQLVFQSSRELPSDKSESSSGNGKAHDSKTGSEKKIASSGQPAISEMNASTETSSLNEVSGPPVIASEQKKSSSAQENISEMSSAEDFILIGDKGNVTAGGLDGLLAKSKAPEKLGGPQRSGLAASGAESLSGLGAESSNDDSAHLANLMKSGSFVMVDGTEEGNFEGLEVSRVRGGVGGIRTPSVMDRRFEDSTGMTSGTPVAISGRTGLSRIPRKPNPAGPPSDFSVKLPESLQAGLNETDDNVAGNNEKISAADSVKMVSGQNSDFAQSGTVETSISMANASVRSAASAQMNEKPVSTGVIAPAATLDSGFRFIKILDIGKGADTYVKGFKASRPEGGKVIGALEVNALWKDGSINGIRAVCGAMGFRHEMVLGKDNGEIKYNGAEGYLYRIKVLEMDGQSARIAIEVKNGQAIGESTI
jgi:tetratricopeptide (TPR) repeat protein